MENLQEQNNQMQTTYNEHALQTNGERVKKKVPIDFDSLEKQVLGPDEELDLTLGPVKTNLPKPEPPNTDYRMW